jgi:hypothetical protein
MLQGEARGSALARPDYAAAFDAPIGPVDQPTVTMVPLLTTVDMLSYP